MVLQPQKNHVSLTKCLIAVGANLPSAAGGVLETARVAFRLLATDAVRLGAVSRFYLTPAYPAGSGPDYVNAAAQLETSLRPAALLAHLHRIEQHLGRTRRARWESRVLDLDLLDYGGLILPDLATYRHWAQLSPDVQRQATPEQLILPHPRLHERAFVLVPLMDIAPDWCHPVWGRSVADMLEQLDPQLLEGIRRVES